ncbi:hypothetical protein CgunFtcFv8_004703 [Champsocephalus gunnari]|uniref:Uncharacterized protein n=1 Tax=Champsocephalus gunnari TaxID=52237 RepID=A0AAN8E7I8_CHAGU|nr:hypothetical protein CgunFtcFv8_004703 [Champsocephalus gunnari]
MAALSSQPYAETQRPSRLVEGLCVVVGRGTWCQMATPIRDVNSTQSCQNATTLAQLVQGTINPSRG